MDFNVDVQENGVVFTAASDRAIGWMEDEFCPGVRGVFVVDDTTSFLEMAPKVFTFGTAQSPCN